MSEKSMKALFVNPPVYDFSAFDLWSKPYGFLFIIDLFIKNGWDVFFFDFMDREHKFYEKNRKDRKFGCGNYYFKIVDKPHIYKDVPRRYKRFGLPDEFFIEFIEKIGRVDFIFLTCGMTYWYPGVEEVINLCRKFMNVPIVLGGAYATFCPEHAKNTGADIIFEGGDIEEFVIQFNNSFGQRFFLPENLEPHWDVYDKISYLVVRTSKGCPFSCYYCGVKKIEKKYLLRNIDHVVREINWNVRKFNIRDIAFYDDALLCNFENHLEKILNDVNKTVGTLNYHTPNGIHPRYINKYSAEFLKQSGFRTIRLSVESLDRKRQKESDFKVNFLDFENAMKNLVDAGYSKEEIGVYILAGLPEQTIENVIDTIKILKQFPCKIKVAEYSPIPGTRDYEIARKLYPFLPIEEPLFQNNSIFPIWNFKDKWEKIDYMKQIARE